LDIKVTTFIFIFILLIGRLDLPSTNWFKLWVSLLH